MKFAEPAAVLGFFLCAFSLTADAQTPTHNDGNKLLYRCQTYVNAVDGGSYSAESVFGQGYCLGVVFGVMNTVQGLCFPDGGLSGNNAARVVVEYLQGHPEELSERDTELIGRSLVAA